MPRMLDLFCGRLGWSKAFLARGWECFCIDLIEPPNLPDGVRFIRGDVLTVAWVGGALWIGTGGDKFCFCHGSDLDFICASSPCEEFSVHGMKHFHPNPKYPENGIRLFNHTREICEASGVPYVMENVRAAQQFVGRAVHHCGPFYLWGSGVPAITPQGILKGVNTGGSVSNRGLSRTEIRAYRQKHDPMWSNSQSVKRKEATASAATIPPELANCVAVYAERLLEQKCEAVGSE